MGVTGRTYGDRACLSDTAPREKEVLGSPEWSCAVVSLAPVSAPTAGGTFVPRLDLSIDLCRAGATHSTLGRGPREARLCLLTREALHALPTSAGRDGEPCKSLLTAVSAVSGDLRKHHLGTTDPNTVVPTNAREQLPLGGWQRWSPPSLVTEEAPRRPSGNGHSSSRALGSSVAGAGPRKWAGLCFGTDPARFPFSSENCAQNQK